MHLLTDAFLGMAPWARLTLILGLVVSLGLALGKLKWRGISVSVGGVLFSGLAAGYFLAHGPMPEGKPAVDPVVIEYLRDFGLILFVYSLGMQVGPGFFASMRKTGLPLTLMALGIVLLGGATAAAIHLADRDRTPVPAMAGLLTGGTTNTPGLSAAQQIMAESIRAKSESARPADAPEAPPSASVAEVQARARTTSSMAYAATYPGAILGIILVMILLRRAFGIDPVAEAAAAAAEQGGGTAPEVIQLRVRKPSAIGVTIAELAERAGPGVVITRHLRGDTVRMAKPDTTLDEGDAFLAVGPKDRLRVLEVLTGEQLELDLRQCNTRLVSRRVLVSERRVLGQNFRELDLGDRYGVSVSRVLRNGLELPYDPGFTLQYGDTVMLVGPVEAVEAASALLGDSIGRYQTPLLIPMFLGLALGAALGAIPIPVGLPAPLKLGVAGGPLIVAILLGRLGRLGPLVFHIPAGANLWIREIGICLFMGCVGIMAGGKFLDTFTHGDGFRWIALGFLITVIPLLAIGFIARRFLRMNYLRLCGVLSGALTDPPALAFAANLAPASDTATVAYAMVYAPVLLLRILMAQILVLVLF